MSVDPVLPANLVVEKYTTSGRLANKITYKWACSLTAIKTISVSHRGGFRGRSPATDLVDRNKLLYTIDPSAPLVDHFYFWIQNGHVTRCHLLLFVKLLTRIA